MVALRPDYIQYCEQRLDGGTYASRALPSYLWPMEWYNISSSFAFILSVIVFCITSHRNHTPLCRIWVGLQIVHGVCTFVNHYTQTAYGLVVDNISVWTMLSFAVFYSQVRLLYTRLYFRRRAYKLQVACRVCACVAVVIWAIVAVYQPGETLSAAIQGTQFAFMVILAIAYLLQQSYTPADEHAAERYRLVYFIIAMLFFITGVVCALQDKRWCWYITSQRHYIGTHTGWHLLGAIALYFYSQFLFPNNDVDFA